MAIVKTITAAVTMSDVQMLGQAIADAWDWGYAGWKSVNSGDYTMYLEGDDVEHRSGIRVSFNSGYNDRIGVHVCVPNSYSGDFYSPFSQSYGANAPVTMHLVRTNSALLLQFYEGEIAPRIDTTTIIVSYATNQYTGLREPVMSVLKVPAINSTAENILYTYIGSKDVLQGETEWKALGYVAGESKISVLAPFFFKYSQCTLDNVFLFTAYQPTDLYRGECTINGRRYYVNNLIAVLDE